MAFSSCTRIMGDRFIYSLPGLRFVLFLSFLALVQVRTTSFMHYICVIFRPQRFRCTDTCTLAHTPTHTNTHIHTQTHTHTFTHTYKYTHTLRMQGDLQHTHCRSTHQSLGPLASVLHELGVLGGSAVKAEQDGDTLLQLLHLL